MRKWKEIIMFKFGLLELAKLEVGREKKRRNYDSNHILDIMVEIRHWLDIQHRNKKVNQSKLRNKKRKLR